MSIIPSSTLDLAIKRRDWLSGHKKRKGRTISVTGGKGGVSKSSITLKLAQELSHRGNRVLVLDCDFNLSNTQLKMGLSLNDNFVSFLQGKKTFAESISHVSGFDLLSGGNGSLDIYDSNYDFEKIIINLLLDIESSYDYVLLDSPAGLSRVSMALNAYSDYRFFVVTPDQSSITDSYSLMKILKNRFGVSKNHLIVNRSGFKQYEKIIKSLPITVDRFLGGELCVLGMIEQMNLTPDQFDKTFLSAEKISSDQFINKLVERFVDEDSEESSSSFTFFKNKENYTSELMA